MSVHVIYYKGRAKMMRPIESRESYLALRGSRTQQKLVALVRQGDDDAKMKLLQMNYSCLPGDDGKLKGASRMSNTVGMDIDHIEPEKMDEVRDHILAHKEELGLLMLERSARAKGFHLVFRRHNDLSQEGNLHWAANLLGVAFDDAAKDVTRVFFTTTASDDDLLFLDDELFDNSGQLPVVGEPCVTALQRYSSDNGDQLPVASNQLPEKEDYPDEYHGIPFSAIIKKYWELWNEGREPQQGDRDTLTYQLAVDLRHICGRNAAWLDQVIPCYDGFTPEEKRQKIANALAAKSEGMPYRLKQVLTALRENKAVKACGGTLTTPPAMPDKLPPLLRLLTKNVPARYKPAVASAVFPALAAHLHGVKFRYWDNVDHEATFMNVLIGRQSVGKGSIRKPIEYITEEIRQRDIPNRQREAEWKQKNPNARQKKDPRPTDICIQMLVDNLTDAVFNQRIVDANNNGERYLYTIVDEIDALKKVTSRGSADEVGLLIRKAFDNSLAGQERVGADSVSGIAPLRWNFNAATTPPNARKFFFKMVNDGTVSRLDVATIMQDEDDEPPVLGIYDHSFAADLKPFLDRLAAASGLIECPAAKKLALEMRQHNSDVAKLYDSEAYRVLSYRANVIAWLKGMLLYVAHGYRWSKEIADFVRWSQQYNLWCKMLYFGYQLERELREEEEIQRHSGPQNLLDLLPDEFSRDEYRLMRQRQGHQGNGDGTLRQWVLRGYIATDEATGKYRKTEMYLKKFRLIC